MAKEDVSFSNSLLGFIQDVGYGIANLFGQGETANNLVNKLKRWIGSKTGATGADMSKMGVSNLSATVNSADLVNYIMKNLGGKQMDLQKVLNVIDSAISKLPAALSRNMRQAVSDARDQLIKKRGQVSSALNKVETTMNTALNSASGQSYYNPSQKIKNQESIRELVDSGNKVYDNIDLDSIERTV